MKIPNKARSVARTLLSELADRVGLTPEQVLALHKVCAPSGDRFSNTMTYLWSTPKSMLRRAIVAGLADPPPAVLDPRFLLLYQLIDQWIVGDPRNFWAESVSTEPVRQICAVCSEPMTSTPSGLVCPNGHGGTEIDFDVANQIEEIFGVAKPEKQVFVKDRPQIKWNDEQSKAFKKIFAWLGGSRSAQQVFRLFGKAGTGKTSMIREVAAAVEAGENGIRKGTVLFAAYTGKAAAVMMKNGCAGATTIHSLIYRAKTDPVTGTISGFTRNEESPLRYARLLIVDEVSMVDADMAADLLSFGVMVLVVGDPKQLRPIKGTGYFNTDRPDVMLSKVERVAAENPLIWLALEVLEHRMPKPGRYGDSRIFKPGRPISDLDVSSADQMIVGLNRTRQALNKRSRMLSGAFDIDSQFPIKGERLMCLKNNKQSGILNGTQWICSEPVIKPIQRLKDPRYPMKGSEPTNLEGLYFRILGLDLFDSEGNGLIVNSVCSTHHFDRNLPEPPWRDIAGTDEFDFAAAATVHKCVHPETLVETREGLIPIRMAAKTGHVATHVGERPYTSKVTNSEGEALRITTEGGYNVIVTPDHKVEIWSDGEYVMKEAHHAKPGDWQRLKLGATVDVDDYATLPLASADHDVRTVIFRTPKVCTEDVAEFLGLMVADGTVFRKGFRLFKRYPDVAERFATLCRNLFGARPSRDMLKSNGLGYMVSSRFLSDWLLSIGGLAPKQKAIPECIYRSPLSVQAAFLRGLFEDGAVNVVNGIVDHIELSQKNRQMLKHVQTMLLRFGIVSALRSQAHVSRLYVYGSHAATFRDRIGFVSEKKQQRLTRCIETERRYRVPVTEEELDFLVTARLISTQSRNNARYAGGFISRERAKHIVAADSGGVAGFLRERLQWHFVRITDIHRGRAPSMCFEVPKVHRFLQNGFPHSNSQGSQFPFVVGLDESHVFEDQRWEHLYTLLTRASDRVHLYQTE